MVKYYIRQSRLFHHGKTIDKFKLKYSTKYMELKLATKNAGTTGDI